MKNFQDFYFHKAKKENYPARSVYKLKEMDEKYRIFHPGAKVLDLGAAPGSWSLGASEKVGNKGLILACDLKPCQITFPDNVFFFQENVFEHSQEFSEQLKKLAPFNVILSDMAPSTTGNKLTDQSRSLELAFKAFEMAKEYSSTGGNFVVKIFMGPDMDELLKQMRSIYKTAKIFKPKSSRSESKETFFIGINKK